MIPGLGRPLEMEMATPSSFPAWRIPWAEEPGGLQSTGSQRVGRDQVTTPLPPRYSVVCMHFFMRPSVDGR